MRVFSLILSCGVLATAASGERPVTFNKDVLPVLQKNCQTCHRPGEVAPMSFLTYQDARPWAKAIKTAVLSHKMPPWFADAKYGHFQNEKRLSDAEIQTLVSWADNGAAEGDAKDKPAPLQFTEGWNIKPDLTVEMPNAFEVPASGILEYQYIVIPTHFEKDTWITAAEVRPGNRAVMHHVIVYVRPPGSNYLKDAQPGIPFVPVTFERDANGAAIRRPQPPRPAQPAGAEAPRPQVNINSMAGVELLTAYAPGLQAQHFDSPIADAAKFVPAGSDLVFQLHYTTNGKAATDKTKIGLQIASKPPKYRHYTSNATQQGFEIPPNDPNYETHSAIALNEPAQLVWLMPHMHVRGKDFLFEAAYPTGERETLLNVPKYDFNWQFGYEEAKPLLLPKDTRIECTAHHDNSVNNPFNPNPNVTVRWGDQTWEEMMMGFFAVVVDANVKPQDVIRRVAPAVKRPAL
ncbi:MAG TPA: cytochrome c [Bryobacteraceae bacterium]|nr:cytochrome c [Bryobacteraceae bacterium]